MATFKTVRFVGALAAFLLFAQATNAGLPLVCNPFDTGDAQVLPWSQPGSWSSIDPKYDLTKLTSDTLRLLSADVPTFARMENLRRATVYAMNDRRVANDLLKAILGRTQAGLKDRAAAIAWFDAGYLVESYRQYSIMRKQDLLRDFDTANPGLRKSLGALDGNAFVQKAIDVTGEADMEYAASLMARDPASADQHRAAAKAKATPGSLLASNLGRN